jgi:hypothetical protein
VGPFNHRPVIYLVNAIICSFGDPLVVKLS